MSRRNKKRKRFVTKHHLVCKSRNGKDKEYNIFYLDWHRHHEPWHKLFSNLTIFEVIELLKRIVEMKKTPEEIHSIRVIIDN